MLSEYFGTNEELDRNSMLTDIKMVLNPSHAKSQENYTVKLARAKLPAKAAGKLIRR